MKTKIWLLGLSCLTLSLCTMSCNEDDPVENAGTPQENTGGTNGESDTGSPEENLPDGPEESLPEAVRNFVGLWCGEKQYDDTYLMLCADGTVHPGDDKEFWTYNPETAILATTSMQWQVNLSNPEAWSGVKLGKNGRQASYHRADSVETIHFYFTNFRYWQSQEEPDFSLEFIGSTYLHSVIILNPTSNPFLPIPSIKKASDDKGDYELSETKLQLNNTENGWVQGAIICTYERTATYRKLDPYTGRYYVLTEEQTTSENYPIELRYNVPPEDMENFAMEITGDILSGTFTFKPQIQK